MKGNERFPAFKVSKADRRNLTDQLADGLRQAIVTGFYKAGEQLPRLKDLATHFGTSLRVPREAIARLVSEGHVDARTSIGTTVLPRRARSWKGHVLFILPDAEGSYYANVFASELQNGFLKAGWLFTRVNVHKRGKGRRDTSILEAALAQSVDLAIILYGDPLIEKFLARRKVPYILIADTCPSTPAPAGFIRFNRSAAVKDFVRRCQEAGRQKVVQVCLDGEGDVNAVPALQRAGIKARREIISFKESAERLETVERSAFDAIGQGLAQEARDNGEVIFFTDDFLAFGGITAILHAGLRVPEDVGLATWSNRGFAPVTPWNLDRMEFDPRQSAKHVTTLVLDFLAGKKIPSHAEIGPIYKPGTTIGP